MTRSSIRLADLVLLAAVVGLTLTTGYIHFWMGGTLLLLNAMVYLGLAILVVGSVIAYRRAHLAGRTAPSGLAHEEPLHRPQPRRQRASRG